MSGFNDFTIFQKILLYLSVLSLIVPLIYIVATWTSIPDQIPTHFNASGEADAWNSKTSVIVLIVVQVFIFILMLFSLLFPQIWNFPVKLTQNNAEAAYRYTRSMLCWITLGINAMFSYINIQSCRGASLGVFFLPVTLGAIAFILIFYMIRVILLPKSKTPQ